MGRLSQGASEIPAKVGRILGNHAPRSLLEELLGTLDERVRRLGQVRSLELDGLVQ